MSEDGMMEIERRIKSAEDIAAVKAEMVHIHKMMDMHYRHMNTMLDSQNAIIASQSRQISTLVDTLNQINLTLSEAKGGWKTFMMIGGIGAAIGTGLMSIMQYLKGLRFPS